MLSALLTLIVGVLLFTIVLCYLLFRELVADKGLRKLLLLMAVLVIPISIYVFLKSLFVKPKAVPFHSGLGAIEDEIEEERVRLFGGSRIRPSFSERWKASYLSALQKAASKVDPPIAPYLSTRGSQHIGSTSLP